MRQKRRGRRVHKGEKTARNILNNGMECQEKRMEWNKKEKEKECKAGARASARPAAPARYQTRARRTAAVAVIRVYSHVAREMRVRCYPRVNRSKVCAFAAAARYSVW